MNTSETENTQDTTRPFGYWITAVDRLMAAEFATAFENEGASRRDWRLLNVVDGTAPARRPLAAHKLRGLIERGWVESAGDGWALTDDGRVAKDRLGAIVDGIRATVTDAVSPEELATTLATLEKVATALGWDEQTPLPRGRGRRRGFGPRGFGPRGFGRGFGGHGHAPRFERDDEHGFGSEHGHGHQRGHGFGPQHGFSPEHGHGFGSEHGCDPRGRRGHGHPGRGRHAEEHGDHPHHGHGHPGRGHRGHGHPGRGHEAGRMAQHAYERGFDAGFSRGRDA